MGDVNQLLFIRRHAARLPGPYLDVGSKDYGTTQDLRSIFAASDRYLGVDLQGGPGVDLTLDLTESFERIDAELDGVRFGTIFCLSVLEHCRQPFEMADNLTRLLAPQGKLCISVPFSFKFHGYPSDYWRFTHEGIRVLFPRVEFRSEDCAWATSKPGELHAADESLGKIEFGWTAHRRQGRLLRAVSAESLKLLSRIGVLSWLTGYRYVLAPTNVLMIGTLRAYKHE